MKRIRSRKEEKAMKKQNLENRERNKRNILTKNSQKTYFYRHYDKNENLLYIGTSLNAINRLANHRKSRWFESISRVEITSYESLDLALAAERVFIHLENPKYNIIRATPSEGDFAAIGLSQNRSDETNEQ